MANETDKMNGIAGRMQEKEVSKMGLGDLIAEMHSLYNRDHNVVSEAHNLPGPLQENRDRYRKLRDELNQREKIYFTMLPGSAYDDTIE